MSTVSSDEIEEHGPRTYEASPIDFSQLFGDPPLMASESKENYDALHEAFACEFNPTGVLDELFVRDITDATLEIERYQRLKSSLIESKLPEALRHHLNRIHDDECRAKIDVDRYFSKIPEEKQAVVQLLNQHGAPFEVIIATAFAFCAPQMAVLERMTNNRSNSRARDLKYQEKRSALHFHSRLAEIAARSAARGY